MVGEKSRGYVSGKNLGEKIGSFLEFQFFGNLGELVTKSEHCPSVGGKT